MCVLSNEAMKLFAVQTRFGLRDFRSRASGQCSAVTRKFGVLRTASFQVGTSNPCPHFVQGQFRYENKFFDLINPATGQSVGTCADASELTVQAAVDSASKCFKSGIWSAERPGHRSRVLRDIASKIMEESEELARAETICCGKLLADSRLDVEESAGKCLHGRRRQTLN